MRSLSFLTKFFMRKYIIGWIGIILVVVCSAGLYNPPSVISTTSLRATTVNASNYVSTPVVLSLSGTNVTIDFSLGSFFTFTATTPFAFLCTNWQAGQTAVIVVTQDSTGNRTVAWETNGFMFPGGFPLALSTNAGTIDVLTTVTSPVGQTNVLVMNTLKFGKQ